MAIYYGTDHPAEQQQQITTIKKVAQVLNFSQYAIRRELIQYWCRRNGITNSTILSKQELNEKYPSSVITLLHL
jgi:hypothetical protein